MELLRTGKVKEVYADGNELLFKFTDKISVFDKIIPTLVAGKGESLCRTSAYWFKKVSEMGYATHFLSLQGKNEMRVRRFDIVEDHGNRFSINYLIPLEFVTRYYVAGSLLDRVENSSIDFHSLGFGHKPELGEELPDPYFEVTTKFERFDRPLSIEEACSIGGLDRSEILAIRDEIFSIDRMIQAEVKKSGLIHADGKKEFALTYRREPVIVDTFGTADEDRFWEASDYGDHRIIELSKEMVRQYYRGTGYHRELYSAREKGSSEPDIPPLPNDLKIKTEELYRVMFERLTGGKI